LFGRKGERKKEKMVYDLRFACFWAGKMGFHVLGLGFANNKKTDKKLKWDFSKT
jgi:hypothetical protein